MTGTLRDRDRYALGDWGTSRVRWFLVEGDAIVARSEGPGIATRSPSPMQVLEQSLASWREGAPNLEVYLAGMAGSRNGVHEAPYVSLPADFEAWSRNAWRGSLSQIDVTIAAGLCSKNSETGGDVIRGEETQVFGALRLDPSLAEGLQVFALPGTHSKWVEVNDGVVERFRTAFTGETYALLRDHSTLLRASAIPDAPDDTQQGFDAGARRAFALQEGLLAALFEARAQQLLAGRSRAWAAGFLSGLLIGYEIETLGRTFHPDRGITLVGDPQLTNLYEAVLRSRGRATRTLSGERCVIEGLRHLADSLRGTT
jgi:2-dehydro-3-deoxygalactonokinase